MKNRTLILKDVCKRFGGVFALDRVSFSAEPGEIIGLIGPNGAGKTTLFNVITGFSRPDSGHMAYGGADLAGQPPFALARMGIARTFQHLKLIGQMSVKDNLRLSCQNQPGERMYNVFFRPGYTRKREHEITDQAYQLLRRVGLEAKADDPLQDLSYGQQKVISLLSCIASKARLYLLDEPVAGISPNMMELICQLIVELRNNGNTVLLVEHNTDVINDICDRVIFLNAGRLICEGSPNEVRQNSEVLEAYLA